MNITRFFAGREPGTGGPDGLGMWCVKDGSPEGPRCSPRYSGPDAQQQAEARAAEMNAEIAPQPAGREMNETLMQAWETLLAEISGDLDLTDSEDRATFRTRLRDRAEFTRVSLLREVALHLDPTTQLAENASRWTCERAISRAFIDRNNSAEEEVAR
jgi:hypothetical protein